MNISSALVTVENGAGERVIEALRAIEGVEVAKVLEDGRIIALIERATTREETAALRAIQETAGVVAAMLTYHHFEEETGI